MNAALSPSARGIHLLADFHGVDPARLADLGLLREAMENAAAEAGAQRLSSHFHGFGDGLGVTGVVLLSESHLSVHTWPEHGYAAFDMFMCGGADPHRALAFLRAALAPRAVELREIPRGHPAAA